jgi:aldehyde:ferredoxin oxidoreductase
MELFEKGYLTEKEIGYNLNFGNADATLELLKATAFRQGFGELLAEGGYAVAERYGHPELFMGVKKLGMPAWHPQGRFKGSGIIGLQYATSNVGACHTRSTLTFNPGSSEIEPLTQWTKHYEDFVAVVDTGVLCWIIYHGPLWEEKPLLWLQLVTGTEYTQEGLLSIGERIWNLERLFNLSAGLSAKDDSLPQRMLTEAPPEGHVVNLAPMLDAYYRIRGWDENGIPKSEKLNQLGLSEWKVKVS